MNVVTRFSLSLALVSGTLALAAEPTAVANKKLLTLGGAKQVASAAAAEARSHNEGGAIAIVDDDGRTLYMTARTSLYRIRLNVPGIRP